MRLKQRLGLRPLHREQAPAVALVGQLHVVTRRLALQVRPVLADVGGVHHHQEFLLADPVDVDVVHQPARVVRQPVVLAAPGPELAHVVRGDMLEETFGVWPLHAELAHVRHVEYTRPGTDSVVLGPHARVLHGHLPPAEGNHAGARAQVRGVQRCPLERRLGGLGHA